MVRLQVGGKQHAQSESIQKQEFAVHWFVSLRATASLWSSELEQGVCQTVFLKKANKNNQLQLKIEDRFLHSAIMAFFNHAECMMAGVDVAVMVLALVL